MSELINAKSISKNGRWHLLTSVCILTLVAGIDALQMASANDTRPTFWIELGGQLERQTGQGDVLSLPFIVNNPESPAFQPESPLHFEKPGLYSSGLEGRLVVQPYESDWNISAAIRYGRSGGRKNVNPGKEVEKQAHFTRAPGYYYTESGQFKWARPETGFVTQTGLLFAPMQVTQRQSHTIMDFSAGKDVGLGVLGKHGTSTLNFGVRFAQFISSSKATIHARPDTEFSYFYPFGTYFQAIFPSLPFRFPRKGFHTYAATLQAERNFHGVGPSISWSASVPIVGNPDEEALVLDWGFNAAILFGRQRASGQHHTSGHYSGAGPSAYYMNSASFNRSRRVVVPNVGGQIGMSLKFQAAKVSLGYRGDFFLGAMDTGVDTRKTKTAGFYGPFATISIGLGG